MFVENKTNKNAASKIRWDAANPRSARNPYAMHRRMMVMMITKECCCSRLSFNAFFELYRFFFSDSISSFMHATNSLVDYQGQ